MFEDLHSLPIWLCIVRQEPIGGQIGCIRIIKAEKGTLRDYVKFSRENEGLLASGYRHGGMCQIMYFHREPDESPLKEQDNGGHLL